MNRVGFWTFMEYPLQSLTKVILQGRSKILWRCERHDTGKTRKKRESLRILERVKILKCLWY